MIVPDGIRIIHYDWLECDIAVILTEKEFNAFLDINEMENTKLNDRLWDSFRGSYAYLLSPEGMAYFALVLNKKSIKSIVHECTHMVHALMHNADIPLSIENTEVCAYMTADLVDKVLDLVNEKEEIEEVEDNCEG